MKNYGKIYITIKPCIYIHSVISLSYVDYTIAMYEHHFPDFDHCFMVMYQSVFVSGNTRIFYSKWMPCL